MPRQRGSTYQADTTEGGRRCRMDGFATYEAAEIWELQARAAVKAGKPLPPGPAKGSGEVTLRELLERTHEDAWKGRPNEGHSVRNAKQFVDWKGATFPARDITNMVLAEYVRHLKSIGLSGSTINRKQAAVTKMFKVGSRTFGLSLLSSDHQPEHGARKRLVSDDEEETILKLSRQWNMPILARFAVALRETGARRGEVQRKMCLAHFQEMPMLVDGKIKQVTALSIHGTKTKGSHRVIVATPRMLSEVVEPFRKENYPEDEPFFPFDDHEAQKWWDRLRAAMRITDPEFVMHSYRHTSVTRMLQAGVDVVKVKDWHGHASLKTTMGYTHLSLGDMAAVVDVLSVVKARGRT